MSKKQKQFKISGIMALLLFAVFAVCVLIVLLNGTNVYNRLVKRDKYSYDSRTAAQYFITRVRQADSLDGIRIEDFDGNDALILSDDIDGEIYETRVYFYDGYIRELYTLSGSEILPEYGTQVLEAKALKTEENDGMIYAEITTPDGSSERFSLYVRSGREVKR